MAELARLGRLLRGEPNEPKRLQRSHRLRWMRSVAMFGLSGFERRIVLLCAGMELDGDFATLCGGARLGRKSLAVVWACAGRFSRGSLGRTRQSGATAPLATDRDDWATVRWSRAACRSTSGFCFFSPALRNR